MRKKKKKGLIFCGDYTDDTGKYKRGNTGKTEDQKRNLFFYCIGETKKSKAKDLNETQFLISSKIKYAAIDNTFRFNRSS